MRTLVSGYPTIMGKLAGWLVVKKLDDLFRPYVSPDGWGWPDN